MGYVGNQQAEGFVQRPTKQDLTGATGTSLTLSHAVSKEEDIDLYINNVKQEPTTAYTVSDTAVTLTGSVVATDDIYVVYNSLALQTVTPPDGSVTSAKLASGAVTDAKIDTMAASKLTGALPAIDGSSLTGIDSGFTEVDQWYLNAGSHTGNSTITDWARVTQTGWSKVGTGMSHSSGVFTFPSTGLYKVSLFAQFRDDQDDNMAADIEVTTDNSTYTVVIQALSGETSGQNSASAVSYFVNVTDTSNVKVRFSADSLDSGSYIIGVSSDKIRTNVMFERIAPAQS